MWILDITANRKDLILITTFARKPNSFHYATRSEKLLLYSDIDVSSHDFFTYKSYHFCTFH